MYLKYLAALRFPVNSWSTMPTNFFPGVSVSVVEETWLPLASMAASLTVALELSMFTKAIPVQPSFSIFVNQPSFEPEPAASVTRLPGWTSATPGFP